MCAYGFRPGSGRRRARCAPTCCSSRRSGRGGGRTGGEKTKLAALSILAWDAITGALPLAKILPGTLLPRLQSRPLRFAVVFLPLIAAIGLALYAVGAGCDFEAGVCAATHAQLWLAYAVLSLVSAATAWLFVLAQESSRAVQAESNIRTQMLIQEIEAHKKTDAALQKAKERAESANVAKTRYVVGITHGLRTPLNAIFGYAQLLERDTALSKPQLESVRVMRRSAEHLANLVDGLLDISRVESGLFRLSPAPINFVEFLDQIRWLLGGETSFSLSTTPRKPWGS